MNAKDVIRHEIEFCHGLTRMYLEDLQDADLLARALPNSNHIAWMLGHMIAGDAEMLKLLGRKGPELPPGFIEKYGKDTASVDDPARFLRKAEYLALADRAKAATLAAVDVTPEADLEKPAPEEMRGYAPTIAAALLILGTHWLMHAGQFVTIRRKLGKPAMF